MSQVNAVDVKNEKPQVKDLTLTQGNQIKEVNGKDTTEAQGKARYEKGMALYKQGKVSIGEDGYYKVNGFRVDTERVRCECPDYQNRKEACKHYFAACFFQKNGCKVVKDSTPVNTCGKRGTSGKRSESNRQEVITRLAVLNTATEILKTHRKPIEIKEVVILASKLEGWAIAEELMLESALEEERGI